MHAGAKDPTMSLNTEKVREHLGQSIGCSDHDQDLVDELSRRLANLERYDEYIANAGCRSHLVAFWDHLKQQEVANVRRLKELIAKEIQDHCF
jgi:hypothetical protein